MHRVAANAEDCDGLTPLALALVGGYAAVVEALPAGGLRQRAAPSGADAGMPEALLQALQALQGRAVAGGGARRTTLTDATSDTHPLGRRAWAGTRWRRRCWSRQRADEVDTEQ